MKVGRLAHQLKRFIGGHYVPELLNKGLEGRAVFVVRECRRRVGDHDRVVVEHHRIARRRLAADVCLGASDKEILDASVVEHFLQV